MGEEDLLAVYLKKTESYVITSDQHDLLLIREGEWKKYISEPEYKKRKETLQGSYIWDWILLSFMENIENATVIYAPIFQSNNLYMEGALLEMAKETRLARKYLSEKFYDFIMYPSTNTLDKKIRFLPSMTKGKGYVFLSLKNTMNNYNKYQKFRKHFLLTACVKIMSLLPNFDNIVGIATDLPKIQTISLLQHKPTSIPEGMREYLLKASKMLNIFENYNNNKSVLNLLNKL